MGGREAREKKEQQRSRVRSTLKLVSFALMGAAVLQELRKPREERTWHGALLGWVPYDLRVPTAARLKASLWAPEDRRLLVPRAFGVGWSPNLGRIVHVVRARAAGEQP